jgi:hypothetical protein
MSTRSVASRPLGSMANGRGVGAIAPWLLALVLAGCSSEPAGTTPDAASVDAAIRADGGAVGAPRASARVLAEFTGHVDPARGTFVIETVTPTAAGRAAGIVAQSLSDLEVDSDGITGSGPTGTVEIVSGTARQGASGCGRADSVCADVTVRSFYTRSIANVYAEIYTMVPATGNEAFNSSTASNGLSDALGLWSYGTLAAGGAAGDSVTRTWGFNSVSSTDFTFRGRVVGALTYTNYTLGSSTQTFVNACTQPGATTNVPSLDDWHADLTLPFEFTFYDVIGSSAWVSTNGVFGFGASSSTTTPDRYNNAACPTRRASSAPSSRSGTTS